jgi:AcrR family transcriptional regulator
VSQRGKGEDLERVTATRLRSEERKQQIILAALEAIGEFGIQGATISRIAKGAGITTAALYSHFENRRAILVATLDKVYEQITDSFEVSSSPDPVQHIRQICELHAEELLSEDKTSHPHLFLEYVASAPEEGLREALREKELETNRHLTSIVRSFQERGSLAKEVDAQMIAWLIACWAWTGDVANLIGAGTVWQSKLSSRLMESILGALSPASNNGGDIDRNHAESPEVFSPPEEQSSPGIGMAPAGALDYDKIPEAAVFTLEETADILKVPTGVVERLVEQKEISSLTLGIEKRISRRALGAFVRGMSDEEFDAYLQGRMVHTSVPEGR